MVDEIPPTAVICTYCGSFCYFSTDSSSLRCAACGKVPELDEEVMQELEEENRRLKNEGKGVENG